jgi:cytoskeletal protein RodZ
MTTPGQPRRFDARGGNEELALFKPIDSNAVIPGPPHRAFDSQHKLAYNFREMPTIGQELRRERELRGVSLADISKITKIKLASLQALEDDKLNLLPGEFFIKGMIRSYAKVVGLDEDQVLTLYAHTLQHKAQDKVFESRKREIPVLASHKPNTLLIGAAAIFVVAITALIVLGFGLKKSMRTASVSAAAKAPATAKVAPPGAPINGVAQPVGPGATSGRTAPAQLSLEISFTQETWIQVSADAKIVLDQVKRPGERIILACRNEFIVNTGNAGGFTFTLNGRKGKSLGAPGAVVKDIRIGLRNFHDYLGGN